MTPNRPFVLVVQHDTYAPPALLGPVAADAGIDLEVLLTAAGDPVPTELHHDGLVVLGGDEFVRDADRRPHLRDEMELIRSAHDQGRPALGICLGAQLAAAALGGAAVHGAKGVEVGWQLVRPAPDAPPDPIAASLGNGTDLFLWHADAIVPPPTAQLIMTADRYPVQGFRMGSVWAVQSHPEVDRETVLSWCDLPGAAEQLRDAGTTPEHLVADIDKRMVGGRRLLAGWCDLLHAPSSSPPR